MRLSSPGVVPFSIPPTLPARRGSRRSSLPAAIRSFNGFYTAQGMFILMNSMRILTGLAAFVGALFVTLVWVLIRYIKRRKPHVKIQPDQTPGWFRLRRCRGRL
jgi:hypothetical protein